MSSVFTLVLILVAPALWAADAQELEGVWILQANECLNPVIPRQDYHAHERWIFNAETYELHFDASNGGRFPECHDLIDRGTFKAEPEGNELILKFVSQDSSSCARPDDGPSVHYQDLAEHPNQTFTIVPTASGPQLYEEYDSPSSQCQRQRWIYSRASPMF